MTKWVIQLGNLGFGGYSPAYWKNAYSSFGNSNQSSVMVSIDLTDPNVLKQGTGLATITGTVDQLMKGILNNVMIADTSVGVGGTKLYDITASAVTAKACGTITGGEDAALYAGNLFYSWNTNIGKTTTAYASPDEDWWTTVAGGAALTTGLPHQMVVAGTSGVLYITNGSKVAEWNGTTATDDSFDTEDSDSVICSIAWTLNRLWIAANKPNVSGRNEASVYTWDGNSDSWDNQVKIDGKVGALFVKNSIPFVFYQKNISQGVCTLGYVDGMQITDLANYYGSLPLYYQITSYEDFIIWASGTALMAFGGGDLKVNTRLFKLGTCGTGGLANPFGTPITASAAKLEKLSGYTVTSSWNSMLFDVTGNARKSMIDKIKFNFDKIVSAARVDLTVVNSQGTSLYTGTISTVGTTTKDFYPKREAENFQLQLSYANGSTTQTVAIRNITIEGHYII